MLKEIDEQPLVIRNIIQKYQDENGEIELNQDIRNAILDSDIVFTSLHVERVIMQVLLENNLSRSLQKCQLKYTWQVNSLTTCHY